MTVPTISNLPTVPATSDPNFETEAPALFNHIKNTFVSEMNSAISFINSSTFDATVEFKNANFTAARNFLYMIDTSSAAISVTLPANPSTGDQLLLMDQKRTFGTNNLTIGRNGQNINGAASNVVSKSTGALIRCIFQASYGWTVDLYEGEWESGTAAGDLVYNGGNVGIGTSSPSGRLDVNTGVMSGDVKIGNFDNVVNGNNTSQLGNGTKLEFIADTNPRYSNHDPYTVAYVKAEYDSTGADTKTGDTALTFATYDGYRGATNGVLSEKMRISSDGNVGIGTSLPQEKLDLYGNLKLGSNGNDAIIKAWTSRGTDEGGNTTSGSNLILKAGIGTGAASGANGQIEFHTESSLTVINNGAPHGSGSAKMVIKSTGKVGIGTSAPQTELQVHNPANAASYSKFTNVNTGATATDGTTVGISTAGDFQIWNWENSEVQIATNNTQRLTIDSSGNVGIGTSTPSERFYVATGEAHVDYATTPPLKGSALRLAANTTHSFICSNQYFGTDGTGGGGNGVRRARDGGCGNIAFDTTSTATAGDIKFETSPNSTQYALATLTERMRIKQAGDVQISTGNLVIGTAGKGIDFSASSHFGGTGGGTGMSSELLTDYEQGTFTPYLLGATTAGSFTYSLQLGRYTKIGNMVQFQITLATSATATAPTGDITIRGLPFTSNSTASVFGSVSIGWTQNITGGADLGAYVINNNTYIALRNITDGSGNMLQGSAVGSTFYFLVTGTYQT